MHKAVGDQLVCVFVDHGLLRKDERKQVEVDYVADYSVNGQHRRFGAVHLDGVRLIDNVAV